MNRPAGYFAPGCYARFIDEFRAMPLTDLRAAVDGRDAARAAGIRYGRNWSQANYSRALDRVARERFTAPDGATVAGPIPAERKDGPCFR